MPRPDEASEPERAPFAYTVIRVVPRVEREEFVNAGVVLFSRPRRFLGARAGIDPVRMRALWPQLDLDAVQRQLDVLCAVAAGESPGGAIAHLSLTERFGWLSAPASTIVQPGPVHGGLTLDPKATLDELFAALVGSLM